MRFESHLGGIYGDSIEISRKVVPVWDFPGRFSDERVSKIRWSFRYNKSDKI